jgi:hypothetical protein
MMIPIETGTEHLGAVRKRLLDVAVGLVCALTLSCFIGSEYAGDAKSWVRVTGLMWVAAVLHGTRVIPYLIPFLALVFAWWRLSSRLLLVFAGFYWILMNWFLGVAVWSV